MTRTLFARLREAPSTVPALAAVGLFVAWAADQAGYPVTHWGPGGLVLLAGRRPGVRRATALGVAAGVANALVAVFSKSTAVMLAHGLLHALASWQLYALLVSGAASLSLASSAFQAGSLAASLPMLTVVDPIAATIIGALFFGESLTIRGLAPIADVASLAAIVAGVFMLGHSPLVHCTHGSGAADTNELEGAGRN